MGPPIGIGGNAAPRRPVASDVALASMGPPIGIGGNGRGGALCGRLGGGLQWGRRSESAETLFSLNAAPHILDYELQWGRRSESAETRRSAVVSSFGVRLLQWGRRSESAETSRVALRRPVEEAASMGPPIGIGGNAWHDMTRQVPAVVLQWGRRSESAETGAARVPDDEHGHASMGPPIGIGGNFNGSSRTSRASRCFNGAADRNRRKPKESSPPLRGSISLQWGRRSESAETKESSPPLRGSTSLQWGRRSESAETRANVGMICGFDT